VEFRNAAEAIDDATAKVAEFRSKLVAHEASLVAAEAGGAPNSGTHSVLFKKLSAIRESQCSDIGTVLWLAQIAASF
jgi:hypothetical protein